MKMRVSHFDQHAVLIYDVINENKPAEGWLGLIAEVTVIALALALL